MRRIAAEAGALGEIEARNTTADHVRRAKAATKDTMTTAFLTEPHLFLHTLLASRERATPSDRIKATVRFVFLQPVMIIFGAFAVPYCKLIEMKMRRHLDENRKTTGGTEEKKR